MNFLDVDILYGVVADQEGCLTQQIAPTFQGKGGAMLEKLVTGVLWGAILGAGYYGTIYAIEYIRVKLLLRRLKE
jgi:hypothetical protein